MLYKPLSRNIAVASVVNFTSSFAMFHPILALYLAQQLHSVFAVTLIYAVITFGSAALEIPTGVIADRFGRKISVVLSRFFDVLAVALLAFGYTPMHFAFYGITVALTSALASGASDALMYDTMLAVDRRSDYQKISGRISALGTAGAAVASLLGGICAAYSLRLPAVLTLIPFVMSAVASLLFIEPPRETLTHGKKSHVVAALRMIFGQKALLPLVASSLIFDLTMEPIYQLLQIFFEQNAIPIAMFGVITCVVMALRSGGAFYGHALTDKIGKHASLLIVIVLSLVLTWVATLLHGWIATVPLMLVYVLFGIIYPLMSDLLNGYLHSHSRATALSMINLVSSLGLTITVPLMGYLADEIGIRIAYRVFVSCLIVILILQDLPQRKESSIPAL